MFFVLIALTSDMVCFLFIPVHWLFFAASTYVWVQYVWHTDRGICLPTVSLWLLFVYIEASVRLKDLKSLSSSSGTVSSSPSLDLCRPFAAHCIGYPVVTLGFGVKSYLSYRMRLRKQREVAKENDFYMELVQQALPEEVIQQQKQKLLLQQQQNISSSVSSSESPAVTTSLPAAVNGTAVMNGHHHPSSPLSSQNHSNSQSNQHRNKQMNGVASPSNHHPSQTSKSSEYEAKSRSSSYSTGDTRSNSINHNHHQNNHQIHDKPNSHQNELHFEQQFLQQQIISAAKSKLSSLNESILSDDMTDASVVSESLEGNVFSSLLKNNSLTNSCPASASNSLSTSCSSTPGKWNQSANVLNSSRNSNSSSNSSTPTVTSVASSSTSSSNKKNKNQEKNHVVNNLKEISEKKDDQHQSRLEADIKRLKADLQASRQTEQELRSQIQSLVSKRSEEDRMKSQLEQLQQDNENLQTKLHNLVTSRQQDKANISMLEKKLHEEKKSKTSLESQLNNERESNKKKQKDQQQQEVKAAAQKECCSDQCKTQKKDLENDLKQTKRELKMREDQVKHMERETLSLRQYKDSHGETELLMSALSAMQDKNAHLESSLSAETRLKLDLFSALGDTKRQLEICQALMAKKDKEIDELKSKIAEVMACMPTSLSSSSVFASPPCSSSSTLDTNSFVSSLLFNSKLLSSHHDSLGSPMNDLTSNGSGTGSSPFMKQLE